MERKRSYITSSDLKRLRELLKVTREFHLEYDICMSSKSSDSFRLSSKLRFVVFDSHFTIVHTPAATASV